MKPALERIKWDEKMSAIAIKTATRGVDNALTRV
jgi:hypothetical protein